MKKLTRKNMDSYELPADLSIGDLKASELPMRVLQFGEGSFLRAFADEMVDALNDNHLFNGSIQIVQPIAQGMGELLNEQNGLYTLILRGLEQGRTVSKKKIVTSIRGVINPYTDFDAYEACITEPELRFIVSNTTEAGIVYCAGENLADKPQASFPGKICALLYKRFEYFKGAADKGFVFIPCELIDYNGYTLKKVVLQHAEEWNLGEAFIAWVNDSNVFTNTLVDRIVTGYPREEAASLNAEFGYLDNCIDTGEIFHFWVIEGPESLAEELPFDKLGLNVLFTKNATPYKQRKVRILNGAHTMSILAAFLDGKDTVGGMMDDDVFNLYLKKGLFDEVIPTLDLEYEDLVDFANAVFDRFANPYIKHYLLSISLNSVSKYKARVLPSVLEYYSRKNEMPKILTFSFAALIAFYKGFEWDGDKLTGTRKNGTYSINDDKPVLEYFKTLWNGWDGTTQGLTNLTKEICGKTEFWGTDLNTLAGFQETVAKHLDAIEKGQLKEEMRQLL